MPAAIGSPEPLLCFRSTALSMFCCDLFLCVWPEIVREGMQAQMQGQRTVRSCALCGHLLHAPCFHLLCAHTLTHSMHSMRSMHPMRTMPRKTCRARGTGGTP